MAGTRKDSQLQIRVSREEKAAIRRAAARSGRDLSAFVLERVLPAAERRWQEILDRLEGDGLDRYVIAELADLLVGFERGDLTRALASGPAATASPEVLNYVAAMVEQVCAAKNVAPPAWTHAIAPLATPWFGSQLQSLRLHLLRSSPAAFRRRNLFIDTGVGGRV